MTAEQVDQITADVALIVKATGMNTAEARQTAALAAANGQGPGYVAELVAHVTNSPSVQNPAGCLRALVQRGTHRPARGAGGVPPRAQRVMLHPEHYRAGGKYAHLFHSVPAAAGGRPTDFSTSPSPQLPPAEAPYVTHPAQRIRGPSAFEVAANPLLAGRGAEAWPRGQPLNGS